jgi:hypothetical protein
MDVYPLIEDWRRFARDMMTREVNRPTMIFASSESACNVTARTIRYDDYRNAADCDLQF